jgi:L-serine dehydratase
MALSVFDLFSIGIGPSSSHTVGPMRAALRFVSGLRDDGLLARTTRVRAELFGSLGATGHGHGSDKAVFAGAGGRAARGHRHRDRADAGGRDPGRLPGAAARHARDRLRRGRGPAAAPQALASVAPQRNAVHRQCRDGAVLAERTYYSVGGGFVLDQTAAEGPTIAPDTTPVTYPFPHRRRVARALRGQRAVDQPGDAAQRVGVAHRGEVRAGLLAIWRVMWTASSAGCARDGVLPGG